MSPLHKPLRTLGGAFSNNHLLTPRDKLGLARLFVVGLRGYARRADKLDEQTVAGYTRQRGVSTG